MPSADASSPFATAPSRKRRMDSFSEPTRKRRHIVADVEDGDHAQVQNEEERRSVEAETALNAAKPQSNGDSAGTAEPALGFFTTVIEDIRALVTCKICFRMLYEPYTLSCGHTHCYSCLSQWFSETTSRRKTCPDCRTVVASPPAPVYLIRELAHKLISRPEFLTDGETLESHAELQREEAEAVDHDKLEANGGLFKGVFKQRSQHLRQGPIVDLDDRVLRCPSCNWELDNGVCERCGPLEDEDDDENDDDDYDEDHPDEVEQVSVTHMEDLDEIRAVLEGQDEDADSEENGSAEEGGYYPYGTRSLQNRPYMQSNSWFSRSSNPTENLERLYSFLGHPERYISEDEEDPEEDEDEGSEMNSFIVDDEEVERADYGSDNEDYEEDNTLNDESSGDNEEVISPSYRNIGYTRNPRARRRYVALSDSDEDVAGQVVGVGGLIDDTEPPPLPNLISISSDDTDSTVQRQLNNQRSLRSRLLGRHRRLQSQQQVERESRETGSAEVSADPLFSFHESDSDGYNNENDDDANDDEDEDEAVTRRLRRSEAISRASGSYDDVLPSSTGTAATHIYPYRSRVMSSPTNVWRPVGGDCLHSNDSDHDNSRLSISNRHVTSLDHQIQPKNSNTVTPSMLILLLQQTHLGQNIAANEVNQPRSTFITTLPRRQRERQQRSPQSRSDILVHSAKSGAFLHHQSNLSVSSLSVPILDCLSAVRRRYNEGRSSYLHLIRDNSRYYAANP